MAKEISTTFSFDLDLPGSTVFVHDPKTGSLAKSRAGTAVKPREQGSAAQPNIGFMEDDLDGSISRGKKGTAT